ncbi:MAG: NAD-dependent succinate-semialdehyde dehydrogenase [Candidatus Diapherotrites archaeon]|nr:NAD-dependent succinate-semialdehyde dehydrogenase [Candidatus Diapherotrites archaeon]
MESMNPATGRLIKKYSLASQAKQRTVLRLARRAGRHWKKIPFTRRHALLKKLALRLRARKDRLARLISLEMGKPVMEARSEIEKCAWACEYYAENSEAFLHSMDVSTDAKKSFVRFDPLGVILGVMPWNFPFWQVFRFSVPCLAAGNTVIVKHSSTVPGCAIEIEKTFFASGFPRGVYQNVVTDAKGISWFIPNVQGVSLTGSVEAGRMIGQQAGFHLKPIVLELGGSDPFVVMGDADVNKACQGAVKGRFVNGGQSCIAAKRFIVVRKKYKAFVQNLVRLVRQLRVGSPLNAATQIGPLAGKAILENLERQVLASTHLGARIACGGFRWPGPGFFYAPTVLTHVKKNMPVWNEETFGPVLPILRVRSDKEALRAANETRFGLGASLWTAHTKKALEWVEEVEAGFVAINGTVVSDPRLPFGGIKDSGMGRELGLWGVRSFANVKTVVVHG